MIISTSDVANLNKLIEIIQCWNFAFDGGDYATQKGTDRI